MTEITLRDVKRVVINPPLELSDKVSRDIVIEMEDGSRLTIELWTTLDTLKVEIN